MKKYNVFRLYVVQKDGHRFICEKIYSDEYREILTKTKIIVDNPEDVESLTNWYALATIASFDFEHYIIKNPMMLTKKSILLKYIEINEKEIEKPNKEINKYIKEIDKDINLMQDSKENKLATNLINMWEDYVDSVKDDMPDIPIMSAKELNKQKKLNKK